MNPTLENALLARLRGAPAVTREGATTKSTTAVTIDAVLPDSAGEGRAATPQFASNPFAVRVTAENEVRGAFSTPLRALTAQQPMSALHTRLSADEAAKVHDDAVQPESASRPDRSHAYLLNVLASASPVLAGQKHDRSRGDTITVANNAEWKKIRLIAQDSEAIENNAKTVLAADSEEEEDKGKQQRDVAAHRLSKDDTAADAHGWGLKQTVLLISPYRIEFDRHAQNSNVDGAALKLFIAESNGNDSNSHSVQPITLSANEWQYACLFASLYSWQHPAVQPTESQGILVEQALASGNRASSTAKAELVAAKQREQQWFRAFDSLVASYSDGSCTFGYFYYVAAHLSVLFSDEQWNSDTGTKDTDLQQRPLAYVVGHAPGIRAYLETHDIKVEFCDHLEASNAQVYPRSKQDNSGSSYQTASENPLLVAVDQRPMRVSGLQDVQKLLALLRQWKQYPTYARRATLPQLLAAKPFYGAAITGAEIKPEKEVVTLSDGQRTVAFRTEIHGAFLAPALRRFVHNVRAHHEKLRVRWRLSTITAALEPLQL
ncbi:hypothetical protein THASP1DRAFT_32569 [Thamnocephalis sphaerospora]|uniref:Uncharacterized protein n=1 Tax=Thamnocephalis sphaerospora TaxID=78915 RepID=A0A4P9XIR1_9FUNG|nr:hypothetical protein THASP1DRAFT_32569 [Thamnocephalis sphaerospora]|eukprot:RKP05597.1 hypothetical protein THASP1DRAFT_32569 [Thamnocephalis sphaerospora]